MDTTPSDQRRNGWMVGAIINVAGVVVAAFNDLFWVAAILAVLAIACLLQLVRSARAT